MLFRSILLPLFLIPGSALWAQNPTVSSILEAIRIDSMMLWVDELSGELPIDVGNGPELILSRHKLSTGNALATDYLVQKLEEFGYLPEIQTFSSSGANILAIKQGSVYPDQVVILCAHYDSMPAGGAAAPGADDNGSGCGAVLEAARLLRNTEFAYTIVFALWDEEEQGLIGAKYYAGVMAANDKLIRGVVNMDAIAYDGNADTKARIHTRPIANSNEIADTLFAVREHYNIDLDLIRTSPGATYSDHAAFWTEGYGAILVIEEFGADGNPFYHTSNDRSMRFDVPYYEKLAKLSIATTATLAEPIGMFQAVQEPASMGSFGLQAWPNPSNSSSTIWVDVPQNGMVQVQLFDAMGGMVQELHQGTLSRGRHSFEVSLNALAAGSYMVLVQGAGSEPRSMRMVRTP